MEQYEQARFICNEPQANSMVLKNEYVVAVCAFPPDGLLISLYGADLIVMKNWKFLHYITDPYP